jgi:hypothetical protein
MMKRKGNSSPGYGRTRIRTAKNASSISKFPIESLDVADSQCWHDAPLYFYIGFEHTTLVEQPQH